MLWAALVPFLLIFAGWGFREQIFTWITGPLRDVQGQMQVLGLFEMFMTYLKLAALAAIFAAAPWMLLQLWLFVAPGLYGHEKRWIGPFILLGTLAGFGSLLIVYLAIGLIAN